MNKKIGKIQKVKTRAVIISGEKQDVMLRDPKVLKEFLEQPTIKIAEAVTGALAVGASGLSTAGGRLIQAAIKGNLFVQFGREIGRLVDEGKIKEDYAEKKYGFQSLADLLNFIDSEAPDEDRFNAVKAMFFALNSVDVKESGEEILRYQLFKLTLSLTSTQILTLKISYDWVAKNETLNPSMGSGAPEWVAKMSQSLGHGIGNLVEIDETVLMDKKLLSPRVYTDRSGITATNARLTQLGMSFCESLQKYSYI